MNRRLLSLLVLVLLLASGSLCMAQEAKPVVVISFSGYDALRADARYLGQLTGQPELAEALDGMIAMSTEGKGLQGLDGKRSWGAAVFSRDEEFSVAVFLPTTDIKALAGTLGALNFQATDQGDGTYLVQTPMQPLVMKEQNGWALMADRPETLANVPDDPTKLLGPLAGKYDLGLMAHVANLPEGVRQMIVAQIGMGAAMGMQQTPDESDEQYAFRRAMTERSIQQLTTMMEELDRFLLGISIDAEAGAGTLEVAVSAKQETKLAEQFALLKETKTNFAGFDQPEAAISAMWSSKLTEEDVEQLKTLLDGVQSAAAEELTKQNLSEDDMTAAKKLMVELFEVLEDNIDAKVADGGMVAKLGADQLAMVAGMYVADGPKIEGLIKEFIDQLVKEQPEAKDHLKLDAETHQGVNLHVLSVPTDEMEEGAEPMRKLVGDQLDLIVGVGPNSLYLAAGRDAASELKQVIDASEAAPDKPISPAKMSIALEPIVKLVADVADDDSAKQVAGALALALSQSPEKDRVTIETRSIPNGSMTRITLEEGVLRLIGTGVTMAMQSANAPGGF
ncbi:MAG: hypothetical protein RBS80_13245 [Thermoguttaceae bacterium]|nr:hypothetical protein [Thermoguttaceae bacterium]